MSDTSPQDLTESSSVQRKSAEPPRGAEVPNADELDQLISKAQELVRTIDTLTTSSEPPSGATVEADIASSSNQEPTTLAELDRVLAADASAMLRTHAATVDAVLDHVFEERAALVQTLHAPSPPAVEVEVEKQVMGAAPAEPVKPQSPESSAQSPGTPVPGTGVPGLSAHTALPPEPELVPQVAAVAPPESKPVVIERNTAAVEPNRFSQTSDDSPRQTLAATVGRVFRPAIPLLVLMNFPIRMVPRSLRPMVDWVALSLAVWVPIVWLMVLTLGGKSEAPATDASSIDVGSHLHTSGEHQSHDAAESDSSAH